VKGGVDFMSVFPGDKTTITGWTVGGPGDGVDWLTTPGFRADSGIHSVDLRNLSASSISTTIPTLTGSRYELVFSAAAVEGWTNTGEVSAGSLINQAFAPSFSFSFSNQIYTPYSFTFTATGSTTLITFQATGPNIGAYGPVIDNVNVVALVLAAVPEPEEWAMMLLGFGMVGYQVKRKQGTAAPAAV
jgi:hypothetical protein